MARETKCRKVESFPQVTEFKPVGIPRSRLAAVVLKVEELEALRLKDLMGLEQEDCAVRMGISRPTFQRILNESRAKAADALINGKAIRIEGGDYCFGLAYCRKTVPKSNDCPYLAEDVKEDSDFCTTGNRIAICAGNDPASALVADHFGHCDFFMIWDEINSGFVPVINTAAKFPRQAGVEAVKELLSQGVGILICNHIGTNAFSVFRKAGGKIYFAEAGLSVQTVLKQCQEGLLPLMESANN